ncbi:hypothetical protein [Nocardioides gansuensis]|nr:hypothetical protein [Nocardioides gansuensis]
MSQQNRPTCDRVARVLNRTVTETFERLPIEQGRAQIDGTA